MGGFLDNILPIAAAVVTTALTGNPAFGALAAGATTTGENLAQGQGIGKSLERGALSGGGSYIGSNIGSALAPAGGAAAGSTAAAAAAPVGSGVISGSGAIGGLAGDSLASATGTGIGGLGDSIGGTLATDSLGSTLGSGAGQTGSTAGSLFGKGLGSLGTVGGALNTTLGDTIGGGISGAIGPTVANTGVGSVLGATIGGKLAEGLAGPDQNPTPTPWTPTRPTASALPTGQGGLTGLDPTQQATNLATQGTFGGGLSPQDESYYVNLLNRQLVDSSGNVSPLSSLSPIESTYNQQLGFGGNTNSTDLLKALSTWSPS